MRLEYKNIGIRRIYHLNWLLKSFKKATGRQARTFHKDSFQLQQNSAVDIIYFNSFDQLNSFNEVFVLLTRKRAEEEEETHASHTRYTHGYLSSFYSKNAVK